MTNLVSSIHLVWGFKAPFVIIYILVCNALLVLLTVCTAGLWLDS